MDRIRHPEKQHRPDNPIQRKPAWIRVKAPTHPVYHETRELMRSKNLVTVCEEAACPNIGECWSQRHATMMIMGEICTRACSFCNVSTGVPKSTLDDTEPQRVADAVAALGLRHVVITSVDRDDAPDGGAAHFAAVIEAIRSGNAGDDHRNPDPGFPAQDPAPSKSWSQRGRMCSTIIWKPCRGSIPASGPERATTNRCACSTAVKRLDPASFTKSGLMVGLGETQARKSAR